MTIISEITRIETALRTATGYRYLALKRMLERKLLEYRGYNVHSDRSKTN